MIIPLHGKYGKGKSFIVDDEDAWMVCTYRWNLSWDGYVQRNFKFNGKNKMGLLSRVILGLMEGDKNQADHITGDKLDNRKENLRIVTNAQNNQNRRHIHKARKTGKYIRGTFLDSRRKKWRAKVKLNGKAHNLGSYDTQEEAGAVARTFRLSNMTHTVEL